MHLFVVPTFAMTVLEWECYLCDIEAVITYPHVRPVRPGSEASVPTGRCGAFVHRPSIASSQS